jgi:Uma2 family endonuclease
MATDLVETEKTPLAVGDGESLYEIVDGVRVELPPMSTLASWVANRIHVSLDNYGSSHQLGQGLMEMLIRLPLPRQRNRRPDVMFVSFERWPADRLIPLTGNAWEIAPDLTVEVVSPTDLANEVMEKLMEYFEAGVRLVWIVYPHLERIYVYQSPNQVRVLTRSDVLDGGNVMPGFQVNVADWLPPIPAGSTNGLPT